MQIIQTSTSDPRFLELEKLLDAELSDEFPEEIGDYAPYNKFEAPIKTILILSGDTPVACGAFKELSDQIEIKRMFVHPNHRGKGLSKIVLNALEQWGKSLGFTTAVLETGDKLFKAIQLYTTSGFEIIPNYGPYIGLTRSVCLGKSLL